MHTLITFLGKGRDNAQTGYRSTRYRFDDGAESHSPFFGLSLAERLQPERLVILGTAGSMWGVLVEHLATEGDDEDRRLRLLDAEARQSVDSALLEEVAPMLARALGREVVPRLISYARDTSEQASVLQAIADAVSKDRISIDLTHGFRHLGMLGLLSAIMLERVGKHRIEGLWYGALEMTQGGVTPVLRLDGLLAIQRWIDALDRFDANGDYSVFAPLLEADGCAADKAHCLASAAFHESTLNLSDARTQLRTFLPALDAPLSGASGLFQDKLRKQLEWALAGELDAHQQKLALRALQRRDYLRAAVLGIEAMITRLCFTEGSDPLDYRARDAADKAFGAQLRDGEHTDWKRDAYWTLKNLRNAMAHGIPPNIRAHAQLLRNPERLHQRLNACLNQLNNT
ncbi:MAG: TIGR02221 family CRISPR-associated protein [Xanthomonadaceae bacterium]|nr:TIGR02221 family CRISPR-associated protein [Xanthomonadaceae bacterium]MDP2186038.1 TIGR02221 family CRISPR-associated protein [Xanthomonadales bacterium]MDZ4117330.1 TIGR02221 family CRISPR-associated protein [Xanthomonadaceae bacterium]